MEFNELFINMIRSKLNLLNCDLNDKELESFINREDITDQLITILSANITILKCRHCGQYFISKNPTAIYCRNTPNGEEFPCNVIGPRYRSNNKNYSKIYYVYTKAYNTHYARVRRGKITKDDFDKWRNVAIDKFSMAKTGLLDISEFEDWLKKW